ncbi:unnamed protein product [Psylliodes chrysocephalus]|uniref:Uncharacterized protein n=1 Tax=Psylliodes chrysocephalus TaxID=3402493 RepID=A0A9P0CMF6_9CUCU|nr:unnamed protein product [Psylliodes chrysocephala]
MPEELQDVTEAASRLVTIGVVIKCDICSEVLSAESIKPSKMKRHLENKHLALINKQVEFFKRKLLSLRSQQVNIKGLADDVSKNALKKSDKARALLGKNSVLIARLKNLMPNSNWVHCFLHRQALAAKEMPDDLRHVLAEAIKVVNYVKRCPLQSRLLENLCEEVGALHKHLQ